MFPSVQKELAASHGESRLSEVRLVRHGGEDEIKVYTDGDWSWHNDAGARRALNEKVAAFQEAGYTVLSAEVYQRRAFPNNLYIKIEYIIPVDSRRSRSHDEVRVYTDGDWSWHNDAGARRALNEKVAAFQEAGYTVLSAEVYQRGAFPNNLYIEIEYIAPVD